MKKYIPLLTLIILIACSTDKKQWQKIKDHPRLSAIFEFADNNRGSMYFDSAISMLNDSIQKDNNFYLRIYDDSIKTIKIDGSVMYKLSKSNIILSNASNYEFKYIDSIYTSQPSIDTLIKSFLINREIGGFYIYYEGISAKENWIQLFTAIDKVKSAYTTERNRYAVEEYRVAYHKLDNSEKNIIKEKIPLGIVVYFRNPFPEPPPMTTEELQKLTKDLDHTKE